MSSGTFFLYGLLALVGVFSVIAIGASCIFVVQGKTAAILETFGRPHKQGYMPGLHFKYPWPITNIVSRVNLQIQEVSKEVSVKTKDNSFMTLPVKVQYRASDVPSGAVLAHYELENPEQQIVSYILNNVRQKAADLNMVELYQNRSAMEENVQEVLTEKFNNYGYIIENVLVDEPQPSTEVRDAFNRVIASEREKEAARNLAEAKKIELVGIATAEKESKKLQGEGISQMRDEIAKGLKAAIEQITEAELSTQEAIQLLMDTNRLDTFSTAAAHGNMIIVDMNQSNDNLVNTLAAVKAANNGHQEQTRRKTA